MSNHKTSKTFIFIALMIMLLLLMFLSVSLLVFGENVRNALYISFYSSWLLVSFTAIIFLVKERIVLKNRDIEKTPAPRTIWFFVGILSLLMGILTLSNAKDLKVILEGFAWLGSGVALIMERR